MITISKAMRPLNLILILFVLVNIIYFQLGGSNPSSRLGTLAAMSEYQSFETSPYKSWTADWAIREDKYYSNKAPGPMLLSWPVYKVWSLIRLAGINDPELRKLELFNLQDEISYLLSLLFQCIPFVLLMLFFIKTHLKRGAETLSPAFFIISMAFGSTASFFFNTFFGHAFAVIGILGFLFYWKEKNYYLSAFFMSIGVLSDYGSIFSIPAAILAHLISASSKNKWSFLKTFLIGSLIPLMLWGVYHSVCFGNPWTLANKYQNPIFQDQIGKAAQLWGIFSAIPSWEVTRNLLWGSSRGILQTQSWVLLTIAYLIFSIIKGRRNFETIFSLSFFAILFYMNISFGGWHGGASPGARYLSASFPALSYALFLEWAKIPKFFKQLLWISLSFSLVFYAHVMSTSILMSGYPILEEAFHWVWTSNKFPGAKVKTLVLLLAFSLLLLQVYKAQKIKGSEK